MSEKKSKRIFFIMYGLVVLILLLFSSCSTSQLTQKQIQINYELDKLHIEYRYKTDSLYNEFYKKETKLNDSLNELLYYVEEDTFNGNLDSVVSLIYVELINEMIDNCENCDEID